ncbi:MAG: MFS transporter [Microbacterium sp.]|uniref:MFS transporter n=1 Tax=Microbacterium sp. TaxID=51671 RepID=UPI0027268A22|nr:MFS transporter [Microbacterium sp.]MDO8382845.1 MFS transporter [Microbacterium sp.]
MTASALNGDVAARRRPDSYPWKVLVVTTLGSLLTFVNSTSLNVALPAISEAFAIPAATADWMLVAFMLTLTSLILVFARISDMVGRKRLYLGGLALMTGASLAAAFALDPTTLIILRCLQGVAAASIIPNMNAMIADAFPHRLLALGLSLNIMMASVASMMGPLVGGVLLGAFGWQSLFLVNVPFGVAALALGIFVLRAEDRSRRVRRVRFDFAGAALSIATLTMLMIGINRVSAWGWQDIRPYLLIAGALCALVAFVAVERRVREPLIDLALVREKARALAYATAFLMSFAQAAVMVVVVLAEQLLRGATPAQTGLIAATLAGSVMVASPLSGLLAKWWSSRTVSSAGALFSLLGYVGVFTSLLIDEQSALLLLSLICIGAGNGIFTAPNTAAIMGGLPENRRGISNGIRSVLFNGALTLGTAIALLIVGQSLQAVDVGGYGEPVADPGAVVGGFQFAAGLLIAFSAGALTCSLARGGPWRATFIDSPNPAGSPLDSPAPREVRSAAP